MYHVEAKNEHKSFSTVHLTSGKLYPIVQMQPSVIQNDGKTMEFMLKNDRGVEKWHHSEWFQQEIKWIDQKDNNS